jgi:putative ABC transport system substrate-binding protein
MRRRTFLAAIGASPFWQAPDSRRTGSFRSGGDFLNRASVATYSFNANAFREGLRETVFVEGQNVIIDRRANNDYGRLPSLATELAGRNVAVIAATGDITSARAWRPRARSPIVFTVRSDPVPFGLVTSLSRPTGNATGVTLFSSTLMAKRLEFLCEVAPHARVVALLVNPDNLNYEVDVKAARDAAQGLGRQTFLAHAKNPAEVDEAFDSIVQKRAAAVLIPAIQCFSANATSCQRWRRGTPCPCSPRRENSPPPVSC